MSDVKICNLDLIAPVQKRELVIGGKTYKVQPLTVAKFIEFQQLRQKVTNDTSVEEGMSLMKEMIHSSVPEMSDEIIDALPVNHLQLVVAFINDEIPDEVLSGKALENKNNKESEEKSSASAEHGKDSGN